MKTYQVHGIDLLHNGERYPEGSPIELDDQTAESKRRWLKPLEASAQAQPVPPEPPEPVTTGSPSKAAKPGKGDDKKQVAGDAATAEGQDNGPGEGEKA